MVLVAGVDHCAEYELQVLSLALSADEFMRSLEYGLVASEDAKPVPTLLDFRVLRGGEMVVGVNLLHDLGRDAVVVVAQFVQEDKVGEAIEVFHVLKVLGGAATAQLLVAGCEALGLGYDGCAEVLVDRKRTAAVDPSLPVDLTGNFLAIAQSSQELVECVREVLGGGSALIELFDICLQESAHIILTDQRLQVIEQLIAFDVLDL